MIELPDRECFGGYDEDDDECYICSSTLKVPCLYRTIKELDDEVEYWYDAYQECHMQPEKLEGEAMKPYVPMT